MAKEFQLTAAQQKELAKLLGTKNGVLNLGENIQEYIEECSRQIALSEIRDSLKEALKHAKGLRRAMKRLSRGHKADPSWIVDPLDECVHYSDALLKYKFSKPLKRGRRHRTPEIYLIQKTALIWEELHQRPPGRGRGPFSRLVSKMFQYSGIKDAPIKHTHEVVAEALPQCLQIRIRRRDCPFATIHESINLPPLKQAADGFFSMVDWVVNGSPTAFAQASPEGGEIGDKK